MKPARDAVRIDSTDLSAVQVVDEMLVFIEPSLSSPLKSPVDRG